ncbi:putative non-specific serine/threonine protein kinase [Medicago truncatula]|uniref:Putative non-specific serine/threonine protein kinase n=1 Tax=Medicago truncatula TaxID=3880 RepID=A0A396HC98_MEDTR|nr:receptor-like protein EIX1 [Medicago truncatula]RHN50278.1 putative non-specific serine/threonine protein kinase [Medicago truncatula]
MLYCGFNFLFCVVAILCINLLCAEIFHKNKCVETERRALLKFKDALILGRNDLTSWKGEECCKWEGISCDNLTGHVTILDLHALDYTKGLQGKLDSSICELQHLTSLNLDNNRIEGKIPKCIGSLGKLIELNLIGNKLVSVIPPSLGNLSNLQTLDLGFNDLTANDLEWISHLSNLRYLGLSNVNLTLAVDWLSSISKIPSLSNLYLFEYLDLSYNEFQSSILKSFRNMSQLQELQLNYNKLSSKLSDNIQKLCSAENGLRKLDLSDNPFIRGPLPDFSCFSSLEALSLRNANVVGTFLKSTVHFPTLRSLDLSQNQLNFVEIIDHAYLPTIYSLDLSFNQLNGSQPLFEITKLASLKTLHLSHNHLSGSIPHTIGQLSSLAKLLLSSNKLSGVINETHLSNLSQLRILDVSQNSLSLNLSLKWVPPFKLERLYASSCTLGPKFPAWLKHQGELEILDISHNGISDSFPKWFWNLSLSLRYLNVSHNILKGTLPKSFTRTKGNYDYDHGWDVWDFSFNNMNGSLPAFPELGVLFLSKNMLTGSLSSFCTSSSQSLIQLDMSSNFLEGQLSDCWGKFKSLEVLNLAENNLSGKLPNSFGALRQIKSLHLNRNNFSGEIPSLILCHKLQLIDVGDNNLQGTLPMWIGHHLLQLSNLRMRANKFQGNIPTSLCNLSFLQVLDLSQNNIIGEIPQCFDRIVALSNLSFPRTTFQHMSFIHFVENEVYETGPFIDKEILAWKGSNSEYDKILGLVTIIDLSCNHLTGEIPQSITKLVALATLNLSRNNLTGIIPSKIGHMERLESLDLSRNHLSGRMPTSFSNLTSLNNMNLSFNNLDDKIPVSTQLQILIPIHMWGIIDFVD